jgi:hydroxyethylthiazole kinase-like sugar kinase family protein
MRRARIVHYGVEGAEKQEIRVTRRFRIVIAVGSALASGCTSAPTAAAPAAPVATAPLASTEVIFYPNAGQSATQQDRDRYECYLWSVRQSGFDPSQAYLEPPQRIVVQPANPPGSTVAAGAVAGAVMGAAIGSPHDEGQGAAIGAVAGAVLGAAAESAQQSQAAQLQGQYDANAAARQARLDAQAGAYRRAMSACLEGRGYTVR